MNFQCNENSASILSFEMNNRIVSLKVKLRFLSTKRRDGRNRADLIESATPCHDAQVMGSYRGSNPLRSTVLALKSEDYTTAPQHLQLASERLLYINEQMKE